MSQKRYKKYRERGVVMVIVIELLVFYAVAVTIKYYKVKMLNRVNYSNYQNCLRALSETDPKLADYLKGRDS